MKFFKVNSNQQTVKGNVMNHSNRIALAALMTALGAASSFGQAFSSGSDGSYGPLNITSNTTLNMPANGIFNCTIINIGSGFTLKFNRNPLNTPVYLLATGDVVITGTIDVSGKNGSASPPTGGDGGPGGFDGGEPGSTPVAPGAGFGPGGGLAGSANATASGAGAGGYGGSGGGGTSTNHGAVYGTPLLIPMVGGSGGGGASGSPGWGGGGGGGAVLVASSTRIDIGGVILARGGAGGNSTPYQGGSGGAVRLVAPVVAGTGSLQVNGGNFGGGAGRVRIDTLNRASLGLAFSPNAATTTIGSLMLVFPTIVPRLDILQAAGTTIPEGNANPVFIQLPFGSGTNRTVTVQARDFNAVVPISVVLTPDSGAPVVYQSQIDNRGASNPAQVIVDVSVPVNVQVTVNAWTR
jgi:hypothetical protein